MEVKLLHSTALAEEYPNEDFFFFITGAEPAEQTIYILVEF